MARINDDGLGERLKEFRSGAGLTQAELARRANVSPAYLSEIEGGLSRRPSGEILLRLAEAMGVTIAELLGRKIHGPEDPSVIPPSLRQLADERGLTDADVKMLASIRFRGDPPRSSRRWGHIFDAIMASRTFDDA